MSESVIRGKFDFNNDTILIMYSEKSDDGFVKARVEVKSHDFVESIKKGLMSGILISISNCNGKIKTVCEKVDDYKILCKSYDENGNLVAKTKYDLSKILNGEIDFEIEGPT